MDASDRCRRASQEAATWWIRLRAEDLTRTEREQFVDWLRESALHVAEMLRVAKVHNVLEEFQGWMYVANGPDEGDNSEAENVVSFPHPGSIPAVAAPSCPHRQGRTRKLFANISRRQLWGGAIAAGLAAVTVSGALLFSGSGAQTIQTERGERREVALADGSILEVDPQTRLEVVFEDHVRRVTLERGRALFRVAKNAARPFLVQADGTTVRAVGTAFGVEHRNQGIIVTVAEGKVGVSVKGASASRPRLLSSTPSLSPAREEAAPEGRTRNADAPDQHGEQPQRARSAERPQGGSQELLLAAGQQVRLSPSGTETPIRNVNSERELAWAKGQLILDDESIAQAVAEFNRYNRIQLHVTNDSLARRTVSGVFDASDPESFIGFLQTVTSVKVVRGESEINMQ